MTLVLWLLQSHQRNLWFALRHWATVWSQLGFWAREHWASASSDHWPWWSQHYWSWRSFMNGLAAVSFLSTASFVLWFRPISRSSRPWGSITMYWTSWSSLVQLYQSTAIWNHSSWAIPLSYSLGELPAIRHLSQDICCGSCHDALAWDHILLRYRSGQQRLPIGSSEYDWIIIASSFAKCFLTEPVLKFFVAIDTVTSMTTSESSSCLQGFLASCFAWSNLPVEVCHV